MASIPSAPSWFYKNAQGRLVNSPSTSGRVMAWGAIVGLIIDDATIDPYAAASGAGKSIFQRTQSAAVGSGLAGGSYSFEMGLGDGAGAQGLIKSNGGMTITPATAAVGLTITQANAARGISITQNGASYGIFVDSASTLADIGAIHSFGKYPFYGVQDVSNGSGLSISRNMAEAGALALVRFTNDNATDTQATLSLQNDGTAAGSVHITTGAANENLRILPNGTGEIWLGYNGIQNFHLSGAAVAAYAAATNVNGATCYIAMQNALDLNKNGGSLDWTGGTAHGSGTGGSLLLRPGGTTSGTRGNVTIYQDAIATTSTDGLVLENSTAATAGVAVQYSPRLRMRGTAWDSAPGSSETADWNIYCVPASAATITSSIYFGSSISGAAESIRMSLSSAGNLSIAGGNFSCGAIATAVQSTLYVQNMGFALADSAIEAATGAWTHSSGEGVAVEIKPTWNASGTAGEICLKLNPTKSAVGSGVYIGIDARGWAAGDAILGVPVDAGALGAYYGRITAYVNGVGLKVIPLYEVA